ncbi:helix-turn-helix domain-containing protein [Bacillota bacterium Meth-B3]|nr:helix-turn-helix transcriptional regulator [Christensenellaceae bacterium]MEA5065675.1 helix-turn-helix transcriptional regulator [Eubacteriales bacterium]MEA5070060.1 helix-turn-helix transcriptional regulator [Christensenellaceae bacterium]
MHFSSRAVGEAIRKQRKEKGLSQEVLSGLSGMGRSHLAMIETGRKRANLETVWRIACALEMRPSQLVERIEEEVGPRASDRA